MFNLPVNNFSVMWGLFGTEQRIGVLLKDTTQCLNLVLNHLIPAKEQKLWEERVMESKQKGGFSKIF